MKFHFVLLAIFTIFFREIDAIILAYSEFQNNTIKFEDLFILKLKPLPYDTSIGLQFSVRILFTQIKLYTKK